MKYLSIKETAEKWDITRRRIQKLCSENRIDGVIKIGNMWAIPENAIKPYDGRKKLDLSTKNERKEIIMERKWAMPNKNTFDIKPIHELLIEEMTNGLWIDPFANRNKLADITNDLNEEFDTNYHLDALEFLRLFDDNSIDGVLYDPPYSPRQVSECYNNVGYNVTWDTTKASFWGNHKKEISRIVKDGGKVITFGWNSGGIGMKNGFDINRILLIPHGGWHNDTICTVEIKRKGFEPKMTKNNVTINTEDIKQIELSIEDKMLIDKLSKLPIGYWDFKGYDTKEYTHGLHNYPAMMVCPISNNIIRLVNEVKGINSLFDPFAGSGTVLVEGVLAGIEHVGGSDINPLALFLTKVKTTPLIIRELQEVCNSLVDDIEIKYREFEELIENINRNLEDLGYNLTEKNGWGTEANQILNGYLQNNNINVSVPNFKNIGYWFKPSVIIELTLIKDMINNLENRDIKEFCFIAFSETIRLVSNRRNGEFKMFRLPIQKVIQHNPNVKKEFFKILERNVQKMNDFSQAVEELDIEPNVSIFKNNSCVLENVPNDFYDLVITSPPYGDSRTTVAYGEFSRLSLQWIDIFELEHKEIMGIDRSLMGGNKYRNGFEYKVNSSTLRLSLERIIEQDIERAGDVYSFYEDLQKAIEATSKKTKIGGYQFWVVGNRTVKNENLKTDMIISEIAANYGLYEIYNIGRNIPNKVMPSKNSPTNIIGDKVTTMCNEHIVILKKVE